MGHWGVRSDENDAAADALDAGFDRVHGAKYEELMDDRNPLSLDKVQALLANPETLAAAIDALCASFGDDLESWDELGRLAFAGVVVRHAELGVPIPADRLNSAIHWLETEDVEWEEATRRRLRKQKEIARLRRLGSPSP
jgi:hypothetical protein